MRSKKIWFTGFRIVPKGVPNQQGSMHLNDNFLYRYHASEDKCNEGTYDGF